ncbi:hypothetical protein [Microvirga antarctica]|uniref:hypothetical protein n=1 Tax=Microvirga antarctica TaxID=2819233 RepID=UPI001B309394|nr:hypothetical protein [Microvirga antarctica]
MDQGLAAVVQHLPHRRRAIMELAMRSESFRSLCADVVDAERALQRWKQTDTPISRARSDEYMALIEGLLNEVELALATDIQADLKP